MTVGSRHILDVEHLAVQYGLTLCVECGKCVSICPMVRIFDDFTYDISPRGVIEAVLLGENSDLLHTAHFWYCLTCDQCTNLCPAGVQFRDFVEVFRQMALEAGVTECVTFCNECGVYLQPQRVMEYLNEALDNFAKAGVMLCPRCRQHEFAGKIRALGLNRGVSSS